MMTLQEIVELQHSLLNEDREVVLSEIRPRVDELLALAEAALWVREAYLRPSTREETDALMHMARLAGAARGAMMNLDKFEERARVAQGITPIRSGR